ncbi:MAG: HDOD domain-containing protein [Planctomycetota bacterium]|nr:MAG: HDOD domain-containing protein [Planctomycetota bacterium]
MRRPGASLTEMEGESFMPPSAAAAPPSPASDAPERLSQQRRVRLLLEQIDSLPALSPVVAKLLAVTADDDADIREIITLVESDVAMTSRVLTLCRRADVGVRDQIVTVERAVVLLGIDALRDTLLCAEIFERLAAAGDQVELTVDLDDEAPALDMKGLWRHSLAVACAAQRLVQSSAGAADSFRAVKPGEAFLAGLLHDLGKWALAVVLPRTFAKLARTAHLRQCDLAPLERRIVSVDHFTAGKRLAQRWGLPRAVRDAIWLHSHPAEAIPEGAHHAMAQLVGAADVLARRACIGWSGDESPPPSLTTLADRLGCDASTLDRVQGSLHAEVAKRAWAIGLEETAERDLLQDSLAQASRKLEQSQRLASRLRHEACRNAARSRRSLEAFTHLLHDAERASDASDLLRRVVASIARSVGAPRVVVAHRDAPEANVELRLCAEDGSVLDAAVETLPSLSAPPSSSWIAQKTVHRGWRLEEREETVPSSHAPQLCEAARAGDAEAFVCVLTPAPAQSVSDDATAALWRVLLKAWLDASQACALADALAQANRQLTEAQPRLAQAAALEMLFETTAGLAHEMNNPLTVIQGWAQTLEEHAPRKGTEAVQRAVDTLAQLVADLHLFSTPLEPRLEEVDLAELLADAAQEARQRAQGGRDILIRLIAPDPSPCVYLDAEHVQQALVELIVNALDAEPRTQVEVRAHLDLATGRLMFSVEDDGVGMEPRVRARCFDPFYSSRAAGRGMGLGLPRARRLVEASGGVIELESQPGTGATARIVFPNFLASRSRTERERA